LTNSATLVTLPHVPRVPLELVSDALRPESPLGFRTARRSLWATGSIAVGFIIARDLPDIPAAWWLAASLALLAVVLFLGGWSCRVGLALAAALFGAGWFALRIHERAATVERLFAQAAGYSESSSADPLLVRASGIVLTTPRVADPSAGELASFFRPQRNLRFSLRVSSLAGPAAVVGLGGVIEVFVVAEDSARALDVRPGDFVSLSGRLSIPGPRKNPGEHDRRALAAQNGVVGRLAVPSITLIERIGTPSIQAATYARVIQITAGIRARASASLAGILDSPDQVDENDRAHAGRALLAAMLLGEREPGYDEADRAFRRLGLVHLVAISGFNLAILAGLALFTVRLTGDHGRLEPLIVVAVVLTYLVVVPAEAPVLRAGFTLLAFLLAESTGRRYDRLTILGWTAAILLLWRPMDLWSLGFQLSFGIVGALLWLAERTEARLFGVPLRGVTPVRRRGIPGIISATFARAGSHLRSAFAASVLAWTVAMPVIAYHTGTISPLAAITGLLVLPLTILVLWTGYLALIVGLLVPDAGEWTGAVATGLADLLVGVVFRLDDLPYMSLSLPRISVWWTLAATLCVLAWFRWWSVRRRSALIATAAVILWLAVELFASTRLSSRALLRIDMLSVGDGSCHLVRSGSEAIMWDCGSSSASFGVRTLPRCLREIGAWRVETVVITHANLDHFSSLVDAAKSMGTRRVLICPAFASGAASRSSSAAGVLLSRLEALGIEVSVVGAGDVIEFGNARMEFLSPPRDAIFSNSNDTSLVALVRGRTASDGPAALLTGDAGVEAIRGVRDRHPGLRADVMELPHHGSFNHEAAALVHALDVRVVLQSTGRRRSGDPRWDDAKQGRTWHTTATGGAARVIIWRGGSITSSEMVGE